MVNRDTVDIGGGKRRGEESRAKEAEWQRGQRYYKYKRARREKGDCLKM